MKKFLALVLALVMTMSLVTISAGAEDFTDDSTITYGEAVDVMTAVGVVGGYADGSFNPTAGLTRGAAAKIICNMLLGPTTAEALNATEAPFSDVAANNVFAGYIAYCVNEGIIDGYTDGTFRPAAPLTGYAFMKMLLCTLGYDKDIEGYAGANWGIAVAKRALNIELDKGLVGELVGTKSLTREEACLYAFNAMKANIVKYDQKSTISVGDLVINQNSEVRDTKVPFYTEFFKKLEVGSAKADAYGRPAHEWVYDKESVGVYADEPIVSYTTTVKTADVVDDLKDAGYKLVNKNYASSVNPLTDKNTDLTGTGAGVLTEVFGEKNAKTGDYEITATVQVVTYIGQITNIVKDKASTKDDDRAFTITVGKTDRVVKAEDELIANFDEIYDEIEKKDWVLFTLGTDTKVETVVIPETFEGKVTKATATKATVDGTVYDITAGSTIAVSADAQTLWLDTYGNVIKSELVDNTSEVVYIVDTFTVTDKFGNDTYYVRVVNADGEIVELQTSTEAKAEYEITFTVATYTTDSDGIATLSQYKKADFKNSGEIKTSTANLGGKYFADGVKFVFIDGVEADLEVKSVEGVQAVTLSKDKVAKYAWNDDSEITVVYVTGTADAAASDDLIFAIDGDKDGSKVDNKGVKADAFKFYIKGVEETEIVSGLAQGFFTYTVDAETGRYTAKAEKNSAVAEMSAATIAQDKYVTVGETCVDYVLADDCAIYDLTENGLTTLAEIDDLYDEDTIKLSIGVAFDAEDEVVTALYVFETPAVEEK